MPTSTESKYSIVYAFLVLRLLASESGSGPREMKSTCRSGHKSDPASACVMTAQAKTAGVVLQTALGQKVYGT